MVEFIPMVRTKSSGDNAVVSDVLILWMIFEHLQWKTRDGENHFGKVFIEGGSFHAVYGKSGFGCLWGTRQDLIMLCSGAIQGEHTGVEMIANRFC